MTHTPGPWGVDSSMISTGWVLVTKSNGDVVANVNTETGPDIPPAVSIKMPALSNAHLIAAAPDMFEALDLYINPPAGMHKDSIYHEIASALAKAAFGEDDLF